MREFFKENKICAILRNIPLEQTLSYAAAVWAGGIRMFEVAMNSVDSVQQIHILNDYFKGEAYVGAGTVTDEERCEAARKAGASFFLTPSVSVMTLEYCRKHGIPLLPGVLTPTDVASCQEYGYDVMKLFPAGAMPSGYVKSLKGPFDGTDYVAVGGVNAGNLHSFFEQGFIGVGIGSNLFPSEYAKNGQWDKVAEYVSELVSRSV